MRGRVLASGNHVTESGIRPLHENIACIDGADADDITTELPATSQATLALEMVPIGTREWVLAVCLETVRVPRWRMRHTKQSLRRVCTMCEWHDCADFRIAKKWSSRVCDFFKTVPSATIENPL